MKMDKHSLAIARLKDGESYEWVQGDCLVAEIWLKHRYYFLFEGKLLGEVPILIDTYIERNLDHLITRISSWT